MYSIKSNQKRIDVFASFIKNLSYLSKCTDKQVAAILTDADLTQVYSIGINGGSKGGIDCICGIHSKYTCIHAEANALAKSTTTDKRLAMFIYPLYPCITCAAMMVNSNVKYVYLPNETKVNIDSRDILLLAGVEIISTDWS